MRSNFSIFAQFAINAFCPLCWYNADRIKLCERRGAHFAPMLSRINVEVILMSTAKDVEIIRNAKCASDFKLQLLRFDFSLTNQNELGAFWFSLKRSPRPALLSKNVILSFLENSFASDASSLSEAVFMQKSLLLAAPVLSPMDSILPGLHNGSISFWMEAAICKF